MRPDLLLIHPPAVRPAEPALGTAALLSRLRRGGATAEAIDANLDAYLYLLDADRLAAAAGPAPATALHRATKNVPRALSFLRSPAAAASFPRYTAAARHLNTALSAYRGVSGLERLTLGDYVHGELSEFSPRDLSLAASGKAGTVFSGYFRDALLPRVGRMRPRGVAISVNYRHQVLPAFELAGLLRRRLPGVPVYGGGGMFTSWRNALRGMGLAFLPFDRIGFGPGESALAAVAGGASAGGGVFFEDGEAVEFLPDFGFAPLREYLSPEPVLPVAAARGCYWRKCRFCPEAVAPVHPYRAADAGT
ncbi:MAG: radical SAM protein, partial [bacterium]|nr:radical SAM protein [bacterium]